MKRNGALPGEAAEQGAALVFLIFGEGGEVDDEEIGECQNGEREE